MADPGCGVPDDLTDTGGPLAVGDLVAVLGEKGLSGIRVEDGRIAWRSDGQESIVASRH